MQTHVQVVTKSDKSLRNIIVNDPQLEEYFTVKDKQQHGREPGWARLVSIDPTKQGSVLLEWDAKTKILLCRIVNKGKGRPDDAVGDLVRYLISRFRNKILIINIIPAKG